MFNEFEMEALKKALAELTYLSPMRRVMELRADQLAAALDTAGVRGLRTAPSKKEEPASAL